jgi:hypothetical protein
MSEPGHQLGQSSAGRGRQDRSGVSQVVEAEVGPARNLPSGIERLVESAWSQVAPAVLCRKQQAVSASGDIFPQVRFQ